jgi:hypothetical protein
MNLTEWESNPQLSIDLRRLLADPVIQSALSVCETMSPLRAVMAKDMDLGMIAHTSQYQLGKQVGFAMWREALASLVEGKVEHREPRQDYNRTQTE